ncbi:hypothetical protein GGR57DRAFT_506387 [Xylariaceae sp. FL1272]|nr:hypothetical protein GGR57DRAFT_506387 [Xylariaceae sp. FL1272]
MSIDHYATSSRGNNSNNQLLLTHNESTNRNEGRSVSTTEWYNGHPIRMESYTGGDNWQSFPWAPEPPYRYGAGHDAWNGTGYEAGFYGPYQMPPWGDVGYYDDGHNYTQPYGLETDNRVQDLPDGDTTSDNNTPDQPCSIDDYGDVRDDYDELEGYGDIDAEGYYYEEFEGYGDIDAEGYYYEEFEGYGDIDAEGYYYEEFEGYGGDYGGDYDDDYGDDYE